MMDYVELQTTSNFSFLRGASHPHELIEQAAALGYKKIALTDRNTFAGIVRAHVAAKNSGLQLIPACRLDLQDGASLLAYPLHKKGYTQLSALLTKGNLRTEKGNCLLYKKDILELHDDLKFIIVPPRTLNRQWSLNEDFVSDVKQYRQAFGSAVYLAAQRTFEAHDQKRLYRLMELARQTGVPLVGTNDVYYHEAQRRELQDVLTCIREKCTIYNAGYRLHQNAERFLKSAEEMQRLFAACPEALERTCEIAEACCFSLSELQYTYPDELTSEGRSPQEELSFLTWKGARAFYGEPLPQKIVTSIQHELRFIDSMNYAPYFLTVYDIVRYARQQGILCQGRGSAANSTVCFVLGITSVDPTKFDLLFERFISAARNEPPDIDVDFEHERREEVIQYIYEKYGRHRAAIVATVTQLHQKGAVRDVAKAMGMSLDAINRLSSSVWEFTDEWFEAKRTSAHGFDPQDPHLRKVLDLTRQYMGFPRQLGQHTGGFVLTNSRLSDLCPILNARMENRTCIEWNKDDIDALGFLKIDVLSLGMLTCIRKSFELLARHYQRQWTLATIPQDDPTVYKMISEADTIGVFQIESRAQQSMLPRLKPKCFYDLVIEVALVRPGPIQGDMVHPYLRRRNGLEPVEYPSKELEDILGKTLGVPLFQEQAMKIAIVAAGFSPAEADELRRSMATFKTKGLVRQFEQKLIQGMVQKGYTQEFAQRVFRQLEGFGSYGFPESHAASFALLVYVSSWIKCYYPEVFACALLNSLPMGFYQPTQIVIDAKNHGVQIRPVDINHSCWDNTLEEKEGPYHILRLGFRQVKGLREEEMHLLIAARQKGFSHIPSLRDAGLSVAALERLAEADAFNSLGLDRRKALWEIAALHDRPNGMFQGQHSASCFETVTLPAMTQGQHVLHDYAATSLSLKAHPLSFLRTRLAHYRIAPANKLSTIEDGSRVRVAGLVLVRQRPATASGVCFITIEDETGVVNLVTFQHLFDRYRKEILYSRLLMIEGKLQKEGAVIHVIAQRCYNLTALLGELAENPAETTSLLTLSRGDEYKSIPPNHPEAKQDLKKKVVQGELFPAGRNFK